MMRRIGSILLALALICGLAGQAAAVEGNGAQNKIVILHTNDVHCAVEDGIGYAGVAAYKEQMQRIMLLSALAFALNPKARDFRCDEYARMLLTKEAVSGYRLRSLLSADRETEAQE